MRQELIGCLPGFPLRQIKMKYGHTGVGGSSWICGFIVFIKFGQYLAIISSNIFSFLFFTSLPSIKPLDAVPGLTDALSISGARFSSRCFVSPVRHERLIIISLIASRESLLG